MVLILHLHRMDTFARGGYKLMGVNHKKTNSNVSAADVRSALRTFLKADDQQAVDACKDIQKEVYNRLLRQSAISSIPEESLQRKFQEVDSAFVQLTRIKQILKMEENKEDDSLIRLSNEGKKYFQERNYEKAMESFGRALQAKPGDTELLLCAGTSALYAKFFDQAAQYADRVLNLQPLDVQAMILKALVNQAKHNYGEAVGLLEKAYEFQPSTKIFKYLNSAREKAKTRTPAPSANSWIKKRRWNRAKVIARLNYNEFSTSIVESRKIVSLSAGGCLLQGQDIPDEFQFTLELNPNKKVWGVGKKIYSSKGYTGVRFDGLLPHDERLIDDLVMCRSR